MPIAVLSLLIVAPLDLGSSDYPIGMFSVDSPPGMREVAAMGVDFVHTYGNGQDLARDIAYLDAAQGAGLRVMYNLNGRRLLGLDDGLAELARLVEGVKDHPALGFWYLYDEPDGTNTPEELAPYYAWLKSHTPSVPVAVACAWSKRWWSFKEQYDLLMIDHYPVQHEPFPGHKLGNMTSFTHSALGLGKPVVPINQCFNWQALAGDAETYRGSPTAELRYPDVAELRYLQYSGLAQGARGMFWWSHYRSKQPDPGWLRNVFAAPCREFAEFTKLVAPAHLADRLRRERDEPAIVACWRRDDGTWLMVVNATATPQDFDLDASAWLTSGRLTPWGGTRDASPQLAAGHVTVRAEPWEVLVWSVAQER